MKTAITKLILAGALLADALSLRAQILYPNTSTQAVTTDSVGSLITNFHTGSTSTVNLTLGTVSLSGVSLLNAIVLSGGATASTSGGILYLNSGGGGGGTGTVNSVTLSGGTTGLTWTLNNPTTTASGTLAGTLAEANGGTGTSSALTGLIFGNGSGAFSASSTLAAGSISGVLAVANGGTGTASPGLVAGTNVTITGTWPSQTIAASGGGGGSGTVASVTLSGGTTGLTWTLNNPTTTASGTLAGTLAEANGGTGTSSALTGILFGNGSGAFSASSTLAAGSLSGTLGTAHGGTGTTSVPLIAANNLSDVVSASTARTNLGLGTAATASSSSFLQAANNLSDVASIGAARTALNIQYPSGSHFLFSASVSGSVGMGTSFTNPDWGPQTDPYGYMGNANLGCTGSYSTAYVCPVSGPVIFGSAITSTGGGTSGARTIFALFEEGALVAVTFDWELPVSSTDTHMSNSTIWNATAGKRYQIEGLTATGSIAVSSGSVFYAQQASPLSARFTAKKVFTTLANAYVTTCSFAFTGTLSGTTGFYPDTAHFYDIMDIRDTAQAVRYNPGAFTATQIANVVAAYAYAQTYAQGLGAGYGIPDAITPASVPECLGGTTPSSSNLPDLDCVYDFVDLIYSHYLKTGSATLYTTYAAAVANALASNTIDHHLVYLSPSAEGPPAWGFQDSIDVRGHDLFTSVERYRAYKEIAAMVAANSGDPTSWNAELPLITAALDTYLYDGTSGMFLTCDTATQSNNVPNIPGSCYAVYIGAASSTSSGTIVTACHNGYTGNTADLAGHGFCYGGQVRHMPRGTYFTTFRSSTPTDTYQNGGYWMTFAPWYAYCLALHDVTEAEEFLNEAANFALAIPAHGAVESYGPQANAYLGASQYLDSANCPLGYYNGIQF